MAAISPGDDLVPTDAAILRVLAENPEAKPIWSCINLAATRPQLPQAITAEFGLTVPGRRFRLRHRAGLGGGQGHLVGTGRWYGII